MNEIQLIASHALDIHRNIDSVIDNMLQGEQAECPVVHKFDDNHYIRELSVKAGVLLIGHLQRFDHLNIFLKGKVLMLNEDGTTTELTAPMTFIGKPGRKIGLILEDMVWQNVYETPIKDVNLLEEMIFDKGDNWLYNAAHRFALEACERVVDRDDYEKALEELGYTEEEVQAMTLYQEDLIDMPKGDYKVTLNISPIQGQGIIATSNIEAGEIIGEANIKGYRTPLGRYTNHAKDPNAEMVMKGDTMYLVAKKRIIGAVGGYQGQEVTVDYRQVRKLIEEQ